MDLYLSESEHPAVIDLSGGQPDLIPEWLPWMMAELRDRGLEHSTYLWSDDNLSNDFFWRYLSDTDIDEIVRYPTYGRVGCFKGFDDASFSFNTGAAPDMFDRQFELMGRLLELGIDVYAYVTFTCPSIVGVQDRMRKFVDRLQQIDENLPLRTVPLEIQVFTPVRSRLNDDRAAALKHQWVAVDAWRQELESRFRRKEHATSISDIPLRHHGPR